MEAMPSFSFSVNVICPSFRSLWAFPFEIFLSVISPSSIFNRRSMESDKSAGTAMTVGTPTAITSVPMVLLLISLLLLPTPAPGFIPVSVICMVLLSLLQLRVDKASNTISRSAFFSLTIALNMSPVSSPVCAITPGQMALTSIAISVHRSDGLILSMTIGPRASAVMFLFPIPASNTFL